MNGGQTIGRTIAASGRDGFIARHALWSDEQQAAAREALAHLESGDVHILRLSFADQHGILRGKGLLAVTRLANWHLSPATTIVLNLSKVAEPRVSNPIACAKSSS